MMRPVTDYFICCLHCTFDVYVWCVISIAIFAVQSFARAAFKVCLCFYLRTTKLVTLFSIQTVNAILLRFIHHFRWPIPRFFVQNPSVGWMRVFIFVFCIDVIDVHIQRFVYIDPIRRWLCAGAYNVHFQMYSRIIPSSFRCNCLF